jgi:hypothetical protein
MLFLGLCCAPLIYLSAFLAPRTDKPSSQKWRAWVLLLGFVVHHMFYSFRGVSELAEVSNEGPSRAAPDSAGRIAMAYPNMRLCKLLRHGAIDRIFCPIIYRVYTCTNFPQTHRTTDGKQQHTPTPRSPSYVSHSTPFKHSYKSTNACVERPHTKQAGLLNMAVGGQGQPRPEARAAGPSQHT